MADDDAELSLDALSAAFAEALGRGDRAVPPRSTETDDSPALMDDSVVQHTTAAAAIHPLSLLEAMLFVGDPAGGALSCEKLAGLMRGVEPREVHDLARELDRRYAEEGSALAVRGEGGGYRLTLRPAYARLRDRFFGNVRQVRLSQAAIDVLSLVAYRQPLAGDEITRLRGVPSGPLLTQLVRRQLLQIERADDRPRVKHYRTTPRFLEVFGLASLDDLPTSQEIDQR